MSKNFTPGVSYGRPAPAVRARLAALRQAYLVHMLKRTIADVTATEERDYRDFGLDKRQVLAELLHLLDTVRTSCVSLAASDSTFRARTGSETDAAVMVVCRPSGTGRACTPGFTIRRGLLHPAAQA